MKSLQTNQTVDSVNYNVKSHSTLYSIVPSLCSALRVLSLQLRTEIFMSRLIRTYQAALIRWLDYHNRHFR